MRKALITGARGQLGFRLEELARRDGMDAIACDRLQLDITEENSIEQALKDHRPDVVINAAAYTAVDRAEAEENLATTINGSALRYLANRCIAHKVDLIHVSTDYVFSGNQDHPYQADDMPSPSGAYGRSKLAGERAILEAFENAEDCRFWIFRVAWLYDSRAQNFAQTMLRLGATGKALKIVNDQWGAPTAAGPFAEILMHVAQNPELLASGIWHYGTSGPTNWYDFAQAIFEHKKMIVAATPCGTDAYPTPAKRPAYSYLDPFPLMNALGREPEHWREQMRRTL